VEHVDSLVAQYRSRGVLVDTGLLLVLYVGLYDPEQIERFERTRQSFTTGDFEFLVALFDQFERIITTPHILTEVSNFLGQLSGHVRDGCFAVFARHVAASSTYEHLPPAEDLTNSAGFVRFGITDTSIVEVTPETYLVLTTDCKLHGRLTGRGSPPSTTITSTLSRMKREGMLGSD
jgi:hypothetical protein